MKDHKNKMAAPLTVTVLLILWYCLYFGFIIYIIDVTWLKIAVAILPLVFSGVLIGVCVQRYHEIKSGEEDDLDQY